MRERVKQMDMGGLLALVLFAVFAVCVLSVLLTGADAYRGLTERDRAAYGQRTAAQYLATRVRQADRAGSVRVETFQGCDALVYQEDVGGEAYLTRVYCYDGYLRELFTAAGADMAPEDGQQVLAAQALELRRTGGTIQAALTDAQGHTLQLTLALRSGEEASP